MATISSNDQLFLEALGGRLESGKGWKVLMRGGNVLLLMPARASAMKAGASLYSPQRALAKLVTKALLKLPLLWRVLPKVAWQWEEDSVLGRVLEKTGAPVAAVLLGNPTHEGRRALVLTEERNPKVVKVGVGKVAARLVARERNFLEEASLKHGDIPKVQLACSGDDWEFFGVPFFQTGDEIGLPALLPMLQGWLEERRVPMSSLPGWQLLMNSKFPGAKDLAEKCREILLRPSLVHGDLAPWNLRRDDEGKLIPIDWEDGRESDVPCWDLVHFAFQRLALVDRKSSGEIKEDLKKLMAGGEFAQLIEESGWAGKENLLFTSYLVAMATEDLHVSALLPEHESSVVKG